MKENSNGGKGSANSLRATCGIKYDVGGTYFVQNLPSDKSVQFKLYQAQLGCKLYYYLFGTELFTFSNGHILFFSASVLLSPN